MTPQAREHGRQSSYATASIFPEIELVVEGEIEPAERETGPTYDCGGTPGHDAFVAGASVIQVVIGRTDLLDGLNVKPGTDIYTFILRLEKAVKDEAEHALMLEAAE